MTWLHASCELFLQGTRGKDRYSTSEEKADCAMAWGPVWVFYAVGLVKEGSPPPLPLGWSASQLLAGEISGQKSKEIDLLLPLLALKIESIFPKYIGKFQCRAVAFQGWLKQQDFLWTSNFQTKSVGGRNFGSDPKSPMTTRPSCLLFLPKIEKYFTRVTLLFPFHFLFLFFA